MWVGTLLTRTVELQSIFQRSLAATSSWTKPAVSTAKLCNQASQSINSYDPKGLKTHHKRGVRPSDRTETTV